MSVRSGDALAYAQDRSPALERAREAVIQADEGGVIAAWNAAAERLYGYAAAEAIGRPLDLLCFPEERGDLGALALARAGAGNAAHDLIQRQRHKSGRELWAALRLTRFGRPGRRPGVLVCAVDVTGRRRAEDDAAASRAALEAGRAELRRVAARLVAGEELARRRIAREIHDDFAQRMAALALELKALRTGQVPGETQRDVLDAAGGSLAGLAEDLRRLSHDLHPVALEHRGLAEALGDHCAELERRGRLEVRLSVRDAAGPFPPDVALGLYRIAQEALANVVRHAGAHSAHVTLMVAAGQAHLSVADDGVGFDPGESRHADGLGLASVEERARLLGGRCRIESAPGAGTEIDVRVPLPAPGPPARELPAAVPRARHVGPYRLLKEIGRGSTASVYLAEEPEPLRRQVALKLHRDPLPGHRETLRFKAEQRALARLHHAAIAEVYEARTTEEGDLYIAMQYVPGMPITAYCDRYGLELQRRLELFAAVCDGVQHAHQKGILHRDLKPANILVMEDGGRPLPKIIDFGVAKGLDRPLADGTLRTTGELIGTPPYLAPEALRGEGLDTRSDVYSLGVVLYELLVGALPFAPGAGEPAGISGWVDALQRGEPPPAPSRRLRRLADDDAAEVARRRGVSDAARLARRLAGDLDRLALKAVAAEPAERYPTVDALGQEVRRVLRGEPVEAGPESTLRQLRRLARRHRRLVAAAVLVILALAGGLVATFLQARRAEREARRADAVARFLEDLFRASDPRQTRGKLPDARELLRRGTERLGAQLADQPLLRARLLDTLGGIHTELGLFDEARPLLDEALAVRERWRGAEHLEVAETLVRLGSLAHLSGHGDAEAPFRRALAIREARLGADHGDVADVLNKLGATLAARGRMDEAEPCLRRALGIAERAWGGDDPRVAKMLHNLSGIAYMRGHSDEAERLVVRALAIRERILPEDDPDLAGSREALALLRQQQGRPAEAAALLERLVASAERVYGPEHPVLARALLNLGLAREDLGEDAAARQALERALALTERTLAPDHALHLRALASLAGLHCGRGRYAEAEPLLRRLLALRAGGAKYDDWDRVLANWTRLLRATGRAGEAARVEARAQPAPPR